METDWHDPPPDFNYILFDRTEPTENAYRFYYVGWQSTLLDDHAVICLWGRKGESQRSRIRRYSTLEEAWPFIRATIRRRIRHGYRIVESSS